jgi:CTP-dependent riboflavin kinase
MEHTGGFARPAFILRPDTDDGKHGDPPEAILEITTDIKLRDTFGLNDGDVVEVEI